jgi:hypothetical protein
MDSIAFFCGMEIHMDIQNTIANKTQALNQQAAHTKIDAQPPPQTQSEASKRDRKKTQRVERIQKQRASQHAHEDKEHNESIAHLVLCGCDHLCWIDRDTLRLGFPCMMMNLKGNFLLAKLKAMENP